MKRHAAVAFSLLFISALFIAYAADAASTGAGAKHLVNINKDGVVVDGHDVVNYFTNHKPAMGAAEFSSAYEGGVYWFSSADHKALFDADPAKYAPQFGGFCAYAVSRKGLRPVDPAIFHFVDGKLFLQHTQKAFDLFEKDERGNTTRAYSNWPGLLKKKADKYEPGQFDEPVK
ncbi:MAG: YHS domain-containing (seleno)protein [Thermoanaerobaculia bacterium]